MSTLSPYYELASISLRSQSQSVTIATYTSGDLRKGRHFSPGECFGFAGRIVPEGHCHDRNIDRWQGRSRSFLVFRLSPKSLRAEDLSWEDDMEFSRRYGRVDTIVTEKSRSADDNRRSKGKSTTKRQVEQPGIMPTLYGRHLIGNTIFLSLKDVAEDLPDYEEHPTPVRMSPALEQPYREMEGKLKEAVARLLRRGNHQLLSGMLHGLLAYPDYPYDWKPIGYVDEKGGPNGRFVLVTTPPTLDQNTLWPKEKKLLEILRAEKAQGRQCWVFAVYTSTHPVVERLERIIGDAGFKVKVLDADKVPTRNRSAWIAGNGPGGGRVISHPQPVRTGLRCSTRWGPTTSHLDLLRDRLRSVHSASGIPAFVADWPEASMPGLLPLLQGNDAGPGDGPDGSEARSIVGLGGAVLCRGSGGDVVLAKPVVGLRFQDDCGQVELLLQLLLPLTTERGRKDQNDSPPPFCPPLCQHNASLNGLA